jgi:hypothetical protein
LSPVWWVPGTDPAVSECSVRRRSWRSSGHSVLLAQLRGHRRRCPRPGTTNWTDSSRRSILPPVSIWTDRPGHLRVRPCSGRSVQPPTVGWRPNRPPFTKWSTGTPRRSGRLCVWHLGALLAPRASGPSSPGLMFPVVEGVRAVRLRNPSGRALGTWAATGWQFLGGSVVVRCFVRSEEQRSSSHRTDHSPQLDAGEPHPLISVARH